jgi:cardiolipin synthase C
MLGFFNLVFQRMKYLLPLLSLLLFSCSDTEDKTSQYKVDFCSQIHDTKFIGLTEALKPMEDSLKNKTGVYILEDGAGAMMTRAWLSENAEKSIDIQYFIFSPDNIGLIACNYLVRAADRGVKVRILIDDIMVDAPIKDLLVLDSHPNIDIKIYNPGVNLNKNIVQKLGKFAYDFRKANQRMHNKTFIVDQKVVITGGRNIADEYFDYDHEYNFRDREVLLLGKNCKDVSKSFEQFWQSDISVDVSKIDSKYEKITADKNTFEALHQYACDTLNYWPSVREKVTHLDQGFKSIIESGRLVWLDSIVFVSDLPGKNDGKSGLKGGGLTTTALIDLINKAKTTIEIQTPYLITTDLGKNLFSAAIKRGVRVRILTNSLASTDNKEAFASYQKDRSELLKLGIEIYEFRPDAEERTKIMTGDLQKTLDKAPIFGLHAKSMVIDGHTTVIGTFNLDPRSANLNTECFALIHSSKIAQSVLKGMEIEFLPQNAWRITPDFNPDDLVSKKKQFSTWTRKILPKSIL